MPILVFPNSFLLPTCHNVNRFVASSHFCIVVVFPSSYCILHRVDGLEIKYTTKAGEKLS